MPHHAVEDLKCFCLFTGIHGPFYLATYRNKAELCFWVLVVLVAVAACLLFLGTDLQVGMNENCWQVDSVNWRNWTPTLHLQLHFASMPYCNTTVNI